ncbi:thioredoxin domain-containing protein [Salinisphaera sp. T31B1]|uniref:DsbA family protein n=1 Tax=Salinisphaera sp. T31B1 TaxID=727963 RepID=UPI00334053BD
MLNPDRESRFINSTTVMAILALAVLSALLLCAAFTAGALTTRLYHLESQANTSALAPIDDEQLEALIKKLIGVAMEAAGTDDEALDRRVRESIRKIAQSSAEKHGQRRIVPSAGNTLGTPVSRVRAVDSERDHILGDPNAPVSLIVYDDFECPFCKRHQDTIKRVPDLYDGRVNVVLRHLPLAMHNPVAQDEALLSKCVARQGGNNAFWQFVDSVFEHSGGNGRGLSRQAVDTAITQLDLDPQDIRDCVDDNRAELIAEVDADVHEASVIGVQGTPGNVVINNSSGQALRLNGARPLAHFSPLFEQMLGGA